MSDAVKPCVIVGGGLSGILLALKLSLAGKQKVTLIEENPTLGGRLFFPKANVNQDSGYGFEAFSTSSKEAIYRHIQNLLSEEELSEFEQILEVQHLPENSHSTERETDLHFKHRRCFFIKKDVVSIEDIFHGTNEIFTKKEGEYLKSLALMNDSLEQNSELSLTIEKSKFWKDLPKSSKDAFGSFFETLFSEYWVQVSVARLIECLHDLFFPSYTSTSDAFSFRFKLEFFLEKILIARGVDVLCSSRVGKVDYLNPSFSLTIQGNEPPRTFELVAEKLILTMPIARMMGIFPKDFLSPEQSRFLSKVAPMSLVVYEIPHVLFQCSQEFHAAKIKTGDQLMFPVEKVQGHVVGAECRLVLSILLPYENSLQAPAVREAVGRLKKAASRILSEEASLNLKKGLRIPDQKYQHRVVLVPVAHVLPVYLNPTFSLQKTEMAYKNLYCCGDSFFSLGDEPWQRIVNSVQEVVLKLSSSMK